MLAAPIVGTSFDTYGTRVGDKRSMMQEWRTKPGDQEAIVDERNSYSAT